MVLYTSKPSLTVKPNHRRLSRWELVIVLCILLPTQEFVFLKKMPVSLIAEFWSASANAGKHLKIKCEALNSCTRNYSSASRQKGTLTKYRSCRNIPISDVTNMATDKNVATSINKNGQVKVQIKIWQLNWLQNISDTSCSCIKYNWMRSYDLLQQKTAVLFPRQHYLK